MVIRIQRNIDRMMKFVMAVMKGDHLRLLGFCNSSQTRTIELQPMRDERNSGRRQRRTGQLLTAAPWFEWYSAGGVLSRLRTMTCVKGPR